MKNTGRTFLKKVAYTAPAIIALGTLSTPTDVRASFAGRDNNNGVGEQNRGRENNNRGGRDNSKPAKSRFKKKC